MIKHVLVVGMGKVGSLVATLLAKGGFEVTGMDTNDRPDLKIKMIVGDVTNPATLGSALNGVDAVISCLPYNLCRAIAEAAHLSGKHYFDLTEDVPTTKRILELAPTSKGVMAPQCGLAPGLIGIVGASLARDFKRIRSISLRVGALPQHPSGLLGYAFNWSSEGVVNEYLNDCEVISGGTTKMVPPMEDLETLFINGLKLEAFTTSGGLGTMCETYQGQVRELNYKTIRYPGHCELMRFFFHELHMRDNRKLAGEILVNAKPPVNEDVVYVYAIVEGWRDSIRGAEILTRQEFVRAYYPVEIDGISWRAISWTTASSAAAVVEMVSQGLLPQSGFIKQEEIPFDKFLKTKSARYYAAVEENRR